MKISVIVPIYNAEKYLQDCIESICNQSYQNFELILVNDGSTDNSETICKKYVEIDERIRLISQDNAGVSAARNRGIEEITGDYLFFQDADDKLLPNAFSYLAGKLEQTKADVIIFGWKEINLYKKESRVVIPGEAGELAADTVIRRILSDNEACGGGYPWNKIWRTAAIRENGEIGKFAEDIFAYEDKLWIIENLKKVKRIYLDTYIWYEYYCRVNSLSHDINNCIFKNGIQAYYCMAKALKGYDVELYQYAKEEYFSRIITDIIVSYRQQNRELLEWMTEKFLKHNGEIYHSKRLGLKFKIKTFLIESYLNKHRRKFCIGYLLKNYPEQRCIINKILSKEYKYGFPVKKIRNFWNIVKMGYDQFGVGVACSRVLAYPYAAGFQNKFTEYLRSRHDDLILRYLKKRYWTIIKKYQNKKNTNSKAQQEEIIWTFWYQGEEYAPELVKKTLTSIKRNAKGRKVVVLDKDTMFHYVEIPKHIIKGVETGKITLIHFSDVLRVELLKKYGGLWIDSTVFVSEEIPDNVFYGNMWSMKKRQFQKSDDKYTWYWTGFLFYAQKGTVLFEFLSDFFYEYWKREEYMIEYLLIDYAISLAYQYIPQVRRDINQIPITRHDYTALEAQFNNEYSVKKWKQMSKELPFQKLTYKREYQKEVNGNATFYGKLMEEEI